MADLVLREADGWFELEPPQELARQVYAAMETGIAEAREVIVQWEFVDLRRDDIKNVHVHAKPDPFRGEWLRVWVQIRSLREWRPPS